MGISRFPCDAKGDGMRSGCLNLENLNALFISEAMQQPHRLQKLNRIAIEQMEILTSEYSRRLLGEGETQSAM